MGGNAEKMWQDNEKFGYSKELISPTFNDMTTRMRGTPIKSHAYEVVCLCESMHIAEVHKDRLKEILGNTDLTSIVIIHGKQYFNETAQELFAMPELIEGKTIVGVSAHTPAVITGSDTPINVGYAAGLAQALPPGIYFSDKGFTFEKTEKE